MRGPKQQLEIEAAQLAKVIELFEVQLADFKQKYWSKVTEIHSFEDGAPNLAEALESARVRQGDKMPEDSFKVAKGAVTCDDT
jgi:hypothetical protein